MERSFFESPPAFVPPLAAASETVHARIVRDLATAGWSVCPDFLAPADAAVLARESRELWELGAFRRAGVGAGQVRAEVRGDHVLWLDEPYVTPALRRYLDELERLRLAINQELFLGLFGFEGHLAVYPPGAGYQRHLDRHRGTSHRVVTVILYLNEGWTEEDGGQLRLDLAGVPHDVLPVSGTLVCFLAGELFHEVLPARRERWSLTGWFRER